MQTAIELQQRMTHSYVGAFRHLDHWERIGSAVETGRQDLTRPEPGDTTAPRRELVTLRVNVEDPGRNVAKAIEDTLTISGCAHDHQSCGCRSIWVSRVRRVSVDLWCAEVHSTRNA